VGNVTIVMKQREMKEKVIYRYIYDNSRHLGRWISRLNLGKWQIFDQERLQRDNENEIKKEDDRK